MCVNRNINKQINININIYIYICSQDGGAAQRSGFDRAGPVFS